MPGINLINAFNYTVVALADRFIKNGSETNQQNNSLSETITEFNKSNDFGKNKLVLLPFLITIGNGRKQELLEFFTQDENAFFYPSYQGILHSIITEEVYKFNNENLVFSSSLISSEIKIEKIKNFETLENYRDSFEDGMENVLLYIDKSISFLHENRIRNFANKSYEQMSYLSKNNFTYQMHYNIDINELSKQEIKRTI